MEGLAVKQVKKGGSQMKEYEEKSLSHDMMTF